MNNLTSSLLCFLLFLQNGVTKHKEYIKYEGDNQLKWDAQDRCNYNLNREICVDNSGLSNLCGSMKSIDNLRPFGRHRSCRKHRPHRRHRSHRRRRLNRLRKRHRRLRPHDFERGEKDTNLLATGRRIRIKMPRLHIRLRPHAKRPFRMRRPSNLPLKPMRLPQIPRPAKRPPIRSPAQPKKRPPQPPTRLKTRPTLRPPPPPPRPPAQPTKRPSPSSLPTKQPSQSPFPFPTQTTKRPLPPSLPPPPVQIIFLLPPSSLPSLRPGEPDSNSEKPGGPNDTKGTNGGSEGGNQDTGGDGNGRTVSGRYNGLTWNRPSRGGKSIGWASHT